MYFNYSKAMATKATRPPMKLGAVFNLWDGEENLSAAVESVRPHVDFLALVWSGKSVFGEQRQQEELVAVGKLVKTLKFDEVVRYEPKGGAIEGDKQKRNQAIDLCKVFECTHFVSLDADDVIKSEHFQTVKAETIEHGYQSTLAPTVLNGQRIAEFTPLIYAIDTRRFGQCKEFPAAAVWSRRLTTYKNIKRRIYVAEEMTVEHRVYNRATVEGRERALRNSLYLRTDG